VTDVPMPGPAVPAAGGGRRDDEILVAFAGPAAQRRLTVLVRMILGVPHLIVLYFLSLAAAVVTFICWFAALFMGRLPEGAGDFLVGWLRWNVRVTAYLWLLTDEYPPFALRDTGYPVRLAAAPGRLNRLAVFFRLILVIPAGIVVVLTEYGLNVVLLIVWLIMLIAGRMPSALYQAVAAIARYQARYAGYACLLTATYPGGLFGDPPGPAAAAVPPAGWGTPAGPGATVAGIPGTGTPPREAPAAPGSVAGQPGHDPQDYLPQGYPGYAQPGYVQPGAERLPSPAEDPRAWRLVLPSGAKKLVGLFLALGLLAVCAHVFFVTTIAGSAHARAQRARTVAVVSQAHATLNNTMNGLQGKLAGCGSSLRCVTALERRAATAFTTFGSVLRSTSMPAGATAATATLEDDTAQVAADFRQLSGATSAQQYRQIAATSGIGQDLGRFGNDYRRLGVALGAVAK
jgi:hypothetical protein